MIILSLEKERKELKFARSLVVNEVLKESKEYSPDYADYESDEEHLVRNMMFYGDVLNLINRKLKDNQNMREMIIILGETAVCS